MTPYRTKLFQVSEEPELTESSDGFQDEFYKLATVSP